MRISKDKTRTFESSFGVIYPYPWFLLMNKATGFMKRKAANSLFVGTFQQFKHNTKLWKWEKYLQGLEGS